MLIITGATGNTGSLVVKKLLQQDLGSDILALIQKDSDTRVLDAHNVKTLKCEFDTPETYVQAIEPRATFIGISNLRHCDAMLPHLERAGISHAHCITTTAVYSAYHSYGALYRNIESRLQAATVPLSLLRPSMIYGNARDHNMHKLIHVLQRTPVFPVFGDGTSLMHPVHVDDLAHGIVTAIGRQAVGAYNLAGPKSLTYNEILTTIADELHRRIRLLHVSHSLAAVAVKQLERIPGFPVRHEQVMRLVEDKAFDISDSVADLDYAPRSFRDGIRQEIEELNAMVALETIDHR